jgi:hypothetical protein
MLDGCLSFLSPSTDFSQRPGRTTIRCSTLVHSLQSFTNPVTAMSAPSESAPTEGAAPDPPARVIDENTDMSTLTDQEIMRLMEGMDHNEDVMSKVSRSTQAGTR